jgi:hypothetical protein
MVIELRRLEKLFRKLGKSLREWPSDPPVEMVHKLRTQTRRMEAIVSSFMLDQEPKIRRLLRSRSLFAKRQAWCAIWKCWSAMRSS